MEMMSYLDQYGQFPTYFRPAAREIGNVRLFEMMDYFAQNGSINASDSEINTIVRGYTNGIRRNEWGGEREIHAIAEEINREIIIYSADGTISSLGSNINGEPIHLYYAGNHYMRLSVQPSGWQAANHHLASETEQEHEDLESDEVMNVDEVSEQVDPLYCEQPEIDNYHSA